MTDHELHQKALELTLVYISRFPIQPSEDIVLAVAEKFYDFLTGAEVDTVSPPFDVDDQGYTK